MLRFFKTYYLPLLSALLLSVSRLPLYLSWLVFFAFIPLLFYFRQRKHSIPENAISALIFSLVQIVLVFYWIGSVTIGGLFGIWLLYALYYLLCFMIVERVWDRLPWLNYLIFISVFISFEYLQNFGEMRFPWWNIGYSLADFLPLIQALELGGMTLLALLILSFNFLFYLVAQRKFWSLFALSMIFLLWFGYGNFRLLTLPVVMQPDRIGVMQPSIVQDDKWDEQKYQEIMQTYDALTADAALKGWSMLIYPEAAVPDYLMLNPGVMHDFRSIQDKHGISIFTGFPHAERAPESYPEPYYSYNAAALFDARGNTPSLYFKNILVPVGERMLWLEYFPFLWKLQFGQANWEFGTMIPRYTVSGKQFSPSICYELAFPHFMQKANFRSEDGARRKADYHVNITNDAWFGTSYGPWLHAVMTKFRAIESRTQIYRSANTGISMIVNPKGEVIAEAGLFQRTNISAPLYTSPTIPLYQKIYHYPWIFVALAAILLFTSFIFPRRAS
jgi:apolipoprotein N-acyltransferase